MGKILKKCPRCNKIQDAQNEECIRCKYFLANVDLYEKKRRPILAFFLSLIQTGLGQAYNGQLRKGIVFFLLVYVFILILSITGLLYTFNRMIILLIIGVVFKIIISAEASYSAINVKRIVLKPYNKWYIYLSFIIIASLTASPFKYIIRNYVVGAYKIPSGSMKPTLLVGDHIIVDMSYKDPQRGDIIVFKYPEDPSRDYIERVIGVAGDVIEGLNKIVYVNGKPENPNHGTHKDPRIIPASMQPRDTFGPITVPANSLFVMGDNRDYSYDSRYWGFVDFEALKGKALYIYLSWDKDNISVRWDRIGNNIE